jgi:glycerophosphoryl diester phosphodiesterase
MVVAHRGASARAPENTLEAAALGFEVGADAWELDVQLSRDGVPLVIHDSSLLRTTDAADRFRGDRRGADGFLVCDFDAREVRSLDAGSWFVEVGGGPRSAEHFGTLATLAPDRVAHFRSGRVCVPTLEEALNLTAELDWLVNIELKSFPESPPGLVEAVLAVIERTGTWDRILVSSFDHRELDRFAQGLAGEAIGPTHPPLGILLWTPLLRPWSYLKDVVGGHTIHVSAESLGSELVAYRRSPSPATLRGEEIAACKARGIPLLVYTVNDVRSDGLARHLAELGVAGLFTDHPGALRALLDTA